MQPTTNNMQQTTNSMQLATNNMQHTTCNMQPTTCNIMQQATNHLQRDTCAVRQRSAPVGALSGHSACEPSASACVRRARPHACGVRDNSRQPHACACACACEVPGGERRGRRGVGSTRTPSVARGLGLGVAAAGSAGLRHGAHSSIEPCRRGLYTVSMLPASNAKRGCATVTERACKQTNKQTSRPTTSTSACVPHRRLQAWATGVRCSGHARVGLGHVPVILRQIPPLQRRIHRAGNQRVRQPSDAHRCGRPLCALTRRVLSSAQLSSGTLAPHRQSRSLTAYCCCPNVSPAHERSTSLTATRRKPPGRAARTRARICARKRESPFSRQL